VHLKNLTVYATGLGAYAGVNPMIWFDNCVLAGTGYADGTTFAGITGWTAGVYVTDAYIHDVSNAVGGASLQRNVAIYNIGSDAFQNSYSVINGSVDGIDPGNTGAHPDVYQAYADRLDNIVLYNISTANYDRQAGSQGVFLSGTSALSPFVDFALVNVNISTGGGIARVFLVGGDLRHIYIRDSSFRGSVGWGTPPTGYQATNLVLANVVFRDYSTGSQTANPALPNATFYSGPDTTAPVLSLISSGIPGNTSATITWTTNELADTQIEYGLTSSYTASSTIDATMVTSHSAVLTGLTPGTTYHYRIISDDPFQNEAVSTDQTFTTSSDADITPPLVEITSPSDAATVSGTSVAIVASSTDNIAVQGVHFILDDTTAIGTEDTSFPYQLSWDSTAVSNGSHTLTAVARDTSNNYATSAPITITVDNTLTSHTITASAGSGGSISPSGSVSVTDGSDQAFAITPNSGYQISSLAVDGSSVSTASTYTFTNVTADHTISATFSAVSSGGGGEL
jgi:hypothetical protein